MQTAEIHSSIKFPGGEYMSKRQVEWFRARLAQMLEECDAELIDLRRQADELVPSGSDDVDMAEYKEAVFRLNSATQRAAMRKREILAAIERINSGDFGYCEDTGEEIGTERLLANPLARYTIEAQQRRERMAKLVA